MRAKEFQESCN